jgi:hypothetical protein
MINQFLSKYRSILGRLKTNEHTIMAVLAVMVGLAAGFGAVGFRYLINFFQSIAYGSSDELLEVVATIPASWSASSAGGISSGPMTKPCSKNRFSRNHLTSPNKYRSQRLIFLIKKVAGGAKIWLNGGRHGCLTISDPDCVL